MRTRGRSRKAQEGAGGGSGASGSVAGRFPTDSQWGLVGSLPWAEGDFPEKGRQGDPEWKEFLQAGR